jgi:predicted amidophosphoribosyltransferase
MPLTVVSFCYYLIRDPAVKWRGIDHDASKFMKAIKGDSINGYATVPINGQKRRLDSSNAEDAKKWFAAWSAKRLADIYRVKPIVLVPVPSSDTVVSSTTISRAGEIARLVAAKLNTATVADILRWTKPMDSSRKKKGPRSPGMLYPSLTALPWKYVPARPHVLIDDNWTTGGHLRACAALLRQHEVDVSLAICASKTAHELPDDPFNVLDEELDDFHPSDDDDTFGPF